MRAGVVFGEHVCEQWEGLLGDGDFMTADCYLRAKLDVFESTARFVRRKAQSGEMAVARRFILAQAVKTREGRGAD